MKATLMISKSLRRSNAIQVSILLFIFLISLMTAYSYLVESHSDWETLISTTSPSDLEIKIQTNFTSYKSIHHSFDIQFNTYNYSSISVLPSSIIEVKIDNQTVEGQLLLINPHFNELTYHLQDNEVILLKDNANGTNLSDVSVCWNIPNITVVNITVLEVHSVAAFRSFFKCTQQLLLDQLLSSNTIIMLESSLFKLPSDAFSKLLQANSDKDSMLLTYFRWYQKNSFIRALPHRTLKAYEGWSRQIITEIYSFVNYYTEKYLIPIQTEFNNVFLKELQILRSTMLAHLLNSGLMLAIVDSLFLYVMFLFVKQTKGDFLQTLNLFSSRGATVNYLNSRIALVSIVVLFGSICLSGAWYIPLLAFRKIIAWQYTQLFSLVFVLIITGLIVYFQFRIYLLIAIKGEGLDQRRKNISNSKSAMFNLLFQTFAIVFSIIFWVLLLISNQQYFDMENIAKGDIVLLVISLVSSISLLIFGPKLIRILIKHVIKRLVIAFASLTKFMLALVSVVYQKRKQSWSILFYLLFFISTLTMVFTTLKAHEEQLNLSYQLGDLSIVTDPSRIADIVEIAGKDNTVVIYFSYITITARGANIFLIDNPLRFYHWALFTSNYFHKYSNLEVFTLLNSSSKYAITSTIAANQNYYRIGQSFQLQYPDGSYATKTLLDTARFIPFVSPASSNWIVAKYDNTQDYPLDFFSVIVSIRENNNNINQVMSYLDNESIWYSIYSQRDQSEYNASDNYFLSKLHNAIILVSIIIPILLALILAECQIETGRQASYLTLRGLKKTPLVYFNIIWFTAHIVFTSIFAIVSGILVIIILDFISKFSYGLPYKLQFSYLSLISPLITIIIALLLPWIFSINYSRGVRLISITANKGGKTDE